MPAPTVQGSIGIGPISVPLPNLPLPGGKKKRSSCRLVSPNDVPGFLNGTVAPWIVWDRVDDIASAWGWGPPNVYLPDSVRQQVITAIGSYRAVAEMHLSVFVPMCQQLEGGEAGWTTDPNAGAGLATYNKGRDAFRQWIKSSNRGPGSNAPPAGGGSQGGDYIPGGEQPPKQAGFGGAGALVLGLAALLVAGKG